MNILLHPIPPLSCSSSHENVFISDLFLLGERNRRKVQLDAFCLGYPRIHKRQLTPSLFLMRALTQLLKEKWRFSFILKSVTEARVISPFNFAALIFTEMITRTMSDGRIKSWPKGKQNGFPRVHWPPHIEGTLFLVGWLPDQSPLAYKLQGSEIMELKHWIKQSRLPEQAGLLWLKNSCNML